MYENSNHLGNVLAVVSDKRILNSSGTYEADVVSAQDYYAFGMIQPGRSFSSDNYRYGFNGKENDNEVKGEGNSVDFGERIYDPRIGRWLSVDKMASYYPDWTPYRFGFNNPNYWSDNEGNIEFPLKGKYAVNKNQSIFLKDQPVYVKRSDSWIKQTGLFEAAGTTQEYKSWEKQGKNANAIIITSAQDMLRRSTKDQPMTSPHVAADFRAAVGTDVYSLGDGKVGNSR